MFWKVTVSQVKDLLRRREAVGVFLVMLIFVLYNFINNVWTFQGTDVVAMYQPMKLLALSYNRVNLNSSITLQFVQIYPILVVCPAGFCLAREYQSGENVYLSSRLGNSRYKWSKMLAAFIVTAIVFVVPFFIEMLLNCISFPLNATGDLLNQGCYESEYLESIHSYLMSGLYIKNAYLYTAVGILILGLFSGLLGAFTVAVSSVIQVKYSVFLFLPVFLLLELPGMILREKIPFSCKWYDYILIFNDQVKRIDLFILGIAVILVFTIAATFVSSRKDCL